MKKKKAILLALAGLTLTWTISWGFTPAPSGEPEKLLFPKEKETSSRYIGVNSCAAAACHNAQGAPGSPGSEYSTWVARPRKGEPGDKHSQAYDVLANDVSKHISRNLGRKKPAQEDSLCLNCHVIPNHDLLHGRDLLPETFVGEGVSCESCHGPAGDWLLEHYRPTWKGKSAAQKAEYGMKDTRSLVGRAKLCVQCHVGSMPVEKGGVGQDVNHDLYAAGHPPLIFEFGAYHATLPRHWPDAKDKDPRRGGTPDFEARAWLVGQVVSAQAALEVLAWRAADKERPWPEFAEMDCFACHHELKSPSPRAGSKGKLPFRSFYYDMLPRALETMGEGDKDISKGLRELKDHMERTVPDKKKVSGLAATMKEGLDRWVAQSEKMERLDLDVLFRDIRDKDLDRAKGSWDAAAQVFLALGALENTRNDLKVAEPHGDLRTVLEWVRKDLRFPSGFDGSSILRKLEELRKLPGS